MTISTTYMCNTRGKKRVGGTAKIRANLNLTTRWAEKVGWKRSKEICHSEMRLKWWMKISQGGESYAKLCRSDLKGGRDIWQEIGHADKVQSGQDEAGGPGGERKPEGRERRRMGAEAGKQCQGKGRKNPMK